MRRLLIAGLTLIVMLSALTIQVPTVTATTATFQPSVMDAYVSNMTPPGPDGNTGTDVEVNIGRDAAGTYVAMGYFWWNISTIPAGSIVSSATVSLYLWQACNPNYLVSIGRVASASWEETTITFNNRPGGANFTWTYPPINPGWWDATITEIATGWIEYGYSNYGLMFSPHTSARCFLRAHSNNYTTDTSLRPRLSITYTAPPPTVETDPATDITDSEATLNGNLTDLGYASTVDVNFQWANVETPSTWNETSTQELSSPSTFYILLSALDNATTYYFRAKAVGTATVYGDTLNFTTDTVPDPPVVATLPATSVYFDSAVLHGNLTSLGDASNVTISFIWGTDPNLQVGTTEFFIINATEPIEDYSETLMDLDPDTDYYFRAKGVGNGTAYGDILSFHTTGPTSFWGDWFNDYGPAWIALLATAAIFITIAWGFWIETKRRRRRRG